jgi:plastocyanin
LVASGCSKNEPEPGRNLPAPAFGQGQIMGVVKLQGSPPVMGMLDAGTCHTGAKAVPDETVIASADGGLANAIVFLIDAPASTGKDQPQLTLDQQQCKYVPRVVAIQTDQELKITTSDPVFHNTHWVSQHNGDVNFGLNRAGEFKAFRFTTPEFFRVRCDVHPWMNAWVGVIDHPFFAVTDGDGKFTMTQVPAGTYRVGVWHELYGKRETTVTVSDAVPAAVRLEYAPPAAQ